MLHIHIEDEWIHYPSLPQKKAWYQAYMKACNTVLGKKAPRIDITIICTSDEKIKELNTRYRQLRRTTDVLSFYYGEDGMTGEGEIFIAVGYTHRQARRLGHSLEKEMARLVVHGIFHIYGYDHMKLDERRVMRALEDKALDLVQQ